jgi:GNAT superfamily N-acetyltransferase
MGIVFRRAAESDQRALARLAGELGYPTAPEVLATRLARLLALPDQAVIVAEEDERVLGWLHVCEFHALTSPPTALVVGLVVESEARGRGIGRTLLGEAEAWARARGLGGVRLRARRERRAAHAFYRSAGYRVHAKQLQFRKEL